MQTRLLLLALGAFLASSVLRAEELDPARDILVTFDNEGARASTVGAPYRARKRYAISAEAMRRSVDVAREYGLQQVDHWPIRSLSVYCFVYRVADAQERMTVIDRLRADARIESVQELVAFETGSKSATSYDDTYANLQYGLDALNLTRAHRYSRGKGIRIAVVDSSADTQHEDLQGRIGHVEDFTPAGTSPERFHGTAVTSIIAAQANNARGIVGVAPEANVDLYVACWAQAGRETAVCDSFTLAKAVDALLDDPPDVVNLSLTGPPDPLLERLLRAAHRKGVILVAASPTDQRHPFPASMIEVIAVDSGIGVDTGGGPIHAPGEQILVATPGSTYDFRSGSSLAAAHVSGVIALMLAVSPDALPESVRSILEQSQASRDGRSLSVDACMALQISEPAFSCDSPLAVANSGLE